MAKKPPHAPDHELWESYTKTVKPLKAKEQVTKAPSPISVSEKKPLLKNPEPLPPVPTKTEEGQSLLIRSAPKNLSVSATIDLHGMTQKQAYKAITNFLDAAYRNRHLWVLIITGKGPLGEKGVLVQRVPEWLDQQPLRTYVSAYALARQPHGGGGAYYVRIRRQVK